MIGGRSLAGIVSQLLYGTSNFLLLGAVAVVAGDSVVGAFSLVYLQVLLWQAVSRAVTGDALLIHANEVGHSGDPTMSHGAVGLTGVIAVPAMVVTAVVGDVLLSWTAAVAFALSLLPVLVYDTSRFNLLARMEPRRAVVTDLVWLVVQGAAYGVAALTVGLTPTTAIVGWGVGALVAAVANWVWTDLQPSVAASRVFWVRSRPTRAGLVASNTLAFVSRNVTYYLIGIAGGLVTLGVVRRGLLPFAPLGAAFLGAASVMTASMSASGTAIGSRTARMAATCATIAVVWGAAAVAAAATVPGLDQVLGSDLVVIALIAVSLVAQGVTAATFSALRACRRTAANAWSVGIGLLVMVAAAWPLTGRWGAAGGALALALGNLTEAAVSAALVGRALSHPPTPAVLAPSGGLR